MFLATGVFEARWAMREACDALVRAMPSRSPHNLAPSPKNKCPPPPASGVIHLQPPQGDHP